MIQLMYHTAPLPLWLNSPVFNLISEMPLYDSLAPGVVPPQALAGLSAATLSATMGVMFRFQMRVMSRAILRFTIC